MYELMVIANLSQNPENVASRVEKMIKDVEATEVKMEKLGERDLAYPIAKQTAGEFFVFNFQAGGDAVNKVSEALRLEREAVLRYLILRVKEYKGRRDKGKKVAKESEESKVEIKTPKVTVKTASNVVTTKVVAKKEEKVVKRSRGKKGKAKA